MRRESTTEKKGTEKSKSPEKKKKQFVFNDKEKGDSEDQKSKVALTAEEQKKAAKPKPVMVDAWTQTDRCDYSIIKYRM